MLTHFTPLTTKNFVADAPRVYEDFYQTHPLVGSGKFSIPLNPILQSDQVGQNIVARQKINLQCLVGFRYSGPIGSITLGTAKLFTFESQDFESIELTHLIDHSEELLFYLKGYLHAVLQTTGIVVEVLSESPRGYSLGFSGTFSGILGYMIHYLKHGSESPLSHGLMNEDRSEIAEIGRTIESILKSPESEGQNSYQTLYAEAAPSVFVFRNGRNGKDRQLRKLVGIENNLRETLEYGVIYSGIPMISKKIELKAGQSEAKNGSLWCANQLGVRLSSKNYSDSLKQVLMLENAHFLAQMDTIFDTKNNQEIGEFLQYGNELAHSFEKLDGKSDFLGHMWKIFQGQELMDYHDIAILPIYSTTKGGSYIWYGRRGIARKNLYLAMQEAQKRYPELNIVFDGSMMPTSFKAEVSIEQDLSQKYTAKHSTAEGYLFTSSDSREILQKYDSGGLSKGRLLVDQISRKIYIDGEKVSSKEILSQQLTIDILDRFINSGVKEIHASDLPSSSYTQSKSEMMSKILSPLMRTVHRRLGSNIRMQCHGSAVDFVIKFEEMNLPLFSIQKIGGKGS